MGKVAWFFLLGLVSCAHHKVPPKAEQLKGSIATISLQNVANLEFMDLAETAVGKRDGVRNFTFDKKTAELRVLYDPKKLTDEKILKFLHSQGIKGTLGSGEGTYAPDFKFPASKDVVWASSKGEKTALENYLAPRKVTVFTFYARWCGECRKLDEALNHWMKKDDFMTVRRVFLHDFDTPVAIQYAVTSLPYVIIYSDDGELVGEVKGYRPAEIGTLLRKGQTR